MNRNRKCLILMLVGMKINHYQRHRKKLLIKCFSRLWIWISTLIQLIRKYLIQCRKRLWFRMNSFSIMMGKVLVRVFRGFIMSISSRQMMICWSKLISALIIIRKNSPKKIRKKKIGMLLKLKWYLQIILWGNHSMLGGNRLIIVTTHL